MSLTVPVDPTSPQPDLGWTFDGTTTDYVTNLQPTTTGTVTYAAGQSNQSVVLTNTAGAAVSNALTYTLSPITSLTNGFTLTCWFKINSTPPTGQRSGIWRIPATGTGNGGAYMLYYASGAVNFGYTQTDQVISYVEFSGNFGALTLGTWYHAAYTISGNTQMAYLNGVLKATDTRLTGTYTLTNPTMGLGYHAALSNDAFNGALGDMRIYTQALSSTQIKSVYNYQAVPVSAGTPSITILGNSITSTPYGLGGTISASGANRLHTYTLAAQGSSNTFTCVQAGFVQLLLVAGGGGGGANNASFSPGGGGGGGEVFYSASYFITPGIYNVIVGAGGAAGVVLSTNGAPGESSAFGDLVANGGGGGNSAGVGTGNGQAGGSGGGCSRTNTAQNGGISVKTAGGLGNTGGNQILTGVTGTGGGGAGSAGADGSATTSATPIAGGTGYASLIYGTSRTYGAGGDGGARNGSYTPTAGTVNRGDGGDGAPTNSTGPISRNGANGGPGTVVISYTDTISIGIAPSMYGAPLFSQLSAAAASSAVGAFSLRAINGVTAKAVQVRANAQLPSFTTAATSIGSNSYSQSLTQYILGGTGTYTVTGSSIFNTGTTEPWRAFDNDTTTRWETTVNLYSGTPGTIYSGTQTTTVGGVAKPGEWLQVKLPTATILTSYSMYARDNFQNRMPYNFIVAGSNNGTTWVQVNSQTGIGSWSGQTPISFNVTSSTSYLYFRLVITAITDGAGLQNVNLGQWTLIGSGSADFYADSLGNLLTAPVTGQLLQDWLGSSTGNIVTWYDQSGNGRNATGTQATIVQSSNVNQQWAVNPTNGGLSVTGGAFLNGTDFTITCTTKRLGTQGNDGVYGYGANASWVGQASVPTTYGDNTRFALVMPNAGSTSVSFNDSSFSAAFSSNANVVPSAFVGATEPTVYTAVTLTGATQRMYVNGTANGAPISTLTQVTANASAGFTVGSVGFYGNFLGEIGELIIFNTALSAPDISTLYLGR